MAALSFNINDVPEGPSREVIPAGEYKVVVEASQEKTTKAGNGSFVEVTLVILEGPSENRKLWDRMNLNNQNEQTVEIATRHMRTLVAATGKTAIQDTADLHDIPVIAVVIVKPDKQTGELRNEIRTYKAVGGGGTNPSAPGKPAPPKAGPTAAPGSKPAWKK